MMVCDEKLIPYKTLIIIFSVNIIMFNLRNLKNGISLTGFDIFEQQIIYDIKYTDINKNVKYQHIFII
jgi:hypothetical protein